MDKVSIERTNREIQNWVRNFLSEFPCIKAGPGIENEYGKLQAVTYEKHTCYSVPYGNFEFSYKTMMSVMVHNGMNWNLTLVLYTYFKCYVNDTVLDYHG